MSHNLPGGPPPFNDPRHPDWYTPPGGAANPPQDAANPPRNAAANHGATGIPRPPESFGGPPAPGYPGQYPAPYPQPFPAAYAPPARSLGIAALVFGLFGIFTLGFLVIPQLLAVILGHLSLRREPAARGFALAGLVLGYAMIALGLGLLALLGAAFSSVSFY